ncbi:hypothetical protein HMF8227_02889 [Saliniradius amylolyticus]|uniref:DUF3570 domain-containing protein n=1 Tax=Saliniradius amylolyticus TaxID=2183582 RepID=A0A2S2E8U5_9ALTE|nr:DUF3570 domain-containing protein [Saliniradius amylolyticus]AWL13337.1 hypothetical protein HMF8227_02889 [Saliniradius amylolyticus]
MQLNKPINQALAAATCALLGTSVHATEQDSDWQFDTALLYYGETDRVTAVEGVFNASKDFGDQRIFNGKLVIDGLTGASANGAIAQPNVQTFTRPSGNGQYDVQSGETPLDDTFRDTRVQLNAQWSQPLWRDYQGSVGVHLSNEYDYRSVALNGSLARDFNRKNTTVSLGLSYAFDQIDPEGGRPVALSSMVLRGNFDSDQAYQSAFDATRLDGTDDKTTVDIMAGVTQVINRRMLMQLNYGVSLVDGYTTDPFKVLSVVNDQGRPQDLVYENRPDTRTRHNIYWRTKYALDYGMADVSYRFATDDWDVQSHTIDSRFRWNLSGTSYLQPHVRFYQQSAAEFYQPYLSDNAMLPQFASADYRIGDMTAYTLGLEYGQTLNNGHQWRFRLEYYQQNPENPGVTLPGGLTDDDIFPSVDAVIAQISYRF